MSEKNNLIEEFLDKKTLQAHKGLVETTDEATAVKNAVILANVFGTGNNFKKIAENKDDEESKLISSFHKNLVLLIQKTWVEKSDEALKAQVLYSLEEFCKKLSAGKYNNSYPTFFSIVEDVVYLMFGNQTKTKEFDEYALRIDPEFGIFWFYITSLPKETEWAEPKTRAVLLLAMYFLANY